MSIYTDPADYTQNERRAIFLEDMQDAERFDDPVVWTMRMREKYGIPPYTFLKYTDPVPHELDTFYRGTHRRRQVTYAEEISQLRVQAPTYAQFGIAHLYDKLGRHWRIDGDRKADFVHPHEVLAAGNRMKSQFELPLRMGHTHEHGPVRCFVRLPRAMPQDDRKNFPHPDRDGNGKLMLYSPATQLLYRVDGIDTVYDGDIDRGNFSTPLRVAALDARLSVVGRIRERDTILYEGWTRSEKHLRASKALAERARGDPRTQPPSHKRRRTKR